MKVPSALSSGAMLLSPVTLPPGGRGSPRGRSSQDAWTPPSRSTLRPRPYSLSASGERLQASMECSSNTSSGTA